METFGKIGIVGLGLIGGSIAAGLCARHTVIGVDTDADAVAYARAQGLVADGGTSVAAVADCDAVFVCVPVGAVAKTVAHVSACTCGRALITDVASVKCGIFAALPPHVRFVGGHPMAGRETGGIRNYAPALFRNAYWCIVPAPCSDPADTAAVELLVRELGALPCRFSPEAHDEAVARVSHLPHVLAYCLADVALGDGPAARIGAGSFRDMTRVSASDPAFWTEIVFENRDRVLAATDVFAAELAAVRDKLAAGDRDAVCALFARANALRRRADEIKADSVRSLVVDVCDRAGALGAVTSLLGAHGVNIAAIAILHSREGLIGALDLGFGTDEDYTNAAAVLREAGYRIQESV